MTGEMYSARQAGRAMLTVVLGTGLFMAAGCKSANPEYEYPEQIGASEQHDPLGRSSNSDEEVGSLLDEDGLVGGLLKRTRDEEKEEAGEAEETVPEQKDTTTEPENLSPENPRLVSAEQQDTTTEPENPEPEKQQETSRADSKSAQARHNPPGLGVNAYLWRATLETLSFMPLASADPYGGVIITDWHANPKAPRERFKVTVYILDKKLRADGLRASVFRQVRSEEGIWVDQAASDDTRIQIENAILTRARQLRVADLNQD